MPRGNTSWSQRAPAPNGLHLITYYPLKEMLKPVNTVTWVTGALLLLLMGIGLAFLILYYRNILLQIRILTGKLMQVEKGDFVPKSQLWRCRRTNFPMYLHNLTGW